MSLKKQKTTINKYKKIWRNILICKWSILEKIIISIWMYSKGIIYYKLMEPKQTVTIQCCNEQLIHLNNAFSRKDLLSEQGS